MTEKHDTITVEIPLSANAVDKDGITVDCLFTALDHASAYHNHEGNYANMFENLDNYIYRQIEDQVE